MNIQIFRNPDLTAVVETLVDEDGVALLSAAGVCAALEIGNSRDALQALDEDEKRVVVAGSAGGSHGGSRRRLYVTESGLYHLIFKSRKAKAAAFRRWVTGEVLPALRIRGSYEVGGGFGSGFPELGGAATLPEFLRRQGGEVPGMEFSAEAGRRARHLGMERAFSREAGCRVGFRLFPESMLEALWEEMARALEAKAPGAARAGAAVGMFINEAVRVTGGAGHVTNGELWARWITWCAEAGLTPFFRDEEKDLGTFIREVLRCSPEMRARKRRVETGKGSDRVREQRFLGVELVAAAAGGELCGKEGA